MRYILAALMLISASAAALAQAQINGLSVTEAYGYPPLKGPNMGVAFVTIGNEGDQTWQLSEVTSPSFASIEIHETIKTDGVMRMRELPGLPLAPGAQIVMQPGGVHLMLMEPLTDLSAGQNLELSLRFTDKAGESVTLSLPVPLKARGAASGGHAHH